MTRTFFLTLFLCLWTYILTVGLTQAADPEFKPTLVNDKYGNKADANSKIVWAPLPKGRVYSASSKAYNDGGLGPLYNFARSFINTVQPKPFPYSIIDGFFNKSFNIANDYMQILMYALGFLVCFVIGILFVIIMPIVGCCFCCCRCCGNCGGKMVQRHDKNAGCKRTVFGLILFILTVFLLTGCLCTYVTNDKIASSLSSVETLSVNKLEDMVKFLNNTVDELMYVSSTNFNFTAQVLSRDLDNIGYLVGIPVRDALESDGGLNATFTSLLGFQTSIDQVYTALTGVNSSLALLKVNGEKLQTSLDKVAKNISDTQTLGSCATSCKNIDTTQLSMQVNFSSLPDISQQLQDMESAKSKDMATLVTQGKKSFDEIPQRVQNETKSTVQSIKDMLTSFTSTIDDNLSTVTKLPNTIIGFVIQATAQITTGSKYVKQYDKYRWYGGIALACISLLIAVLMVVGLLLGCCGSNAKTPPTERGCVSNSGGLMLMSAVGFIFIFSWLLMLLTTILFLLGGNLEKCACQPLMDPSYTVFKQLIDKKDGPLTTGYAMGKFILQDATIDLTLHGILEGCKQNGAAYTVMKLNKLIDIANITDYKKQVDIDKEIRKINVDLSSVEIISADTEKQLRDLVKALNLDYAGFEKELDQNTTKVNLTEFSSVLRAIANDGTNTDPAKTQLLQEADEVDAINNGIYKTVQQAQANLLASIRNLKTVSGQVESSVNTTLDNAKASQQYIQTQGSNLVVNVSLIYAKRLIGIADSYVTKAVSLVDNDVGKCQPIWNLWYSLVHLILCKYTVDTLNGFWFSLGWSIFFMVPSLIFAVKLAKHFRRMDYEDMNDGVKMQGPPPFGSRGNEEDPGPQTVYPPWFTHNSLSGS